MADPYPVRNTLANSGGLATFAAVCATGPSAFFSYFFLILNSPERRADAPQCRHWDLGALPSKKPAIPSTRSNRNRTVAGQQDVLW